MEPKYNHRGWVDPQEVALMAGIGVSPGWDS